MRILLDTHVFLWAVSASDRLSDAARDALRGATEIHVSAASIWEIAIKRGLGRIEAAPEALVAVIERSGFRALPISPQHAAAVATFPNHYRDPFDRILIAQALSEPLRLVTADAALANCSDLVLLV